MDQLSVSPQEFKLEIRRILEQEGILPRHFSVAQRLTKGE